MDSLSNPLNSRNMQVSSTKLFLVFLVQLWDNSLGLKKQDNFFVHGQKIVISKEDSVLRTLYSLWQVIQTLFITCSIPKAKVHNTTIHHNICTEVVKHCRNIILHNKKHHKRKISYLLSFYVIVYWSKKQKFPWLMLLSNKYCTVGNVLLV